MELINIAIENNVHVITLNNGKVNAISPEVIIGLNKALDHAEQEKAVVILTGQAGIFSGGFDLKTMKKSSYPLLTRLNNIFYFLIFLNIMIS